MNSVFGFEVYYIDIVDVILLSLVGKIDKFLSLYDSKYNITKKKK
jgi:hypothetical protein